MARKPKPKQTPIEAFKMQKWNASKRGIEFNLTYEEWQRIWDDSGHFAERGRRRGQYVMCRVNDIGPYAVGNVFIDTTENNIRAMKPYARTDEHRRKASLAATGHGFTEEGLERLRHPKKKIQCSCGKMIDAANQAKWHFKCLDPNSTKERPSHSPEVRAQIAAKHTGKKHAPEAIDKMKQARLAYWTKNTGRKHSPETIEKMRQARLAQVARAKSTGATTSN